MVIVFVAPWLGVGLLAGASSIASNIWNAREAAKNRRFQERMSSTAHQREVRDLRFAGINPMVRHLSGASTPAGDRAEMEDAGGKGLSSALQAKLLEAQTDLIRAQANKTRTEEGVLTLDVNAGRFRQRRAEMESAELSAEQARRMLPIALERAKAEVEQLVSSARAAKARAMLDEAARTGALNVEQFERELGEMSPRVRFFMEVLRSLRGTIQ